jgi:hypothetical protein
MVVVVRFVKLYVEVELEMLVQVLPPFLEYSQFRTVPTWPVKYNEPVFVPVHTVSPPITEPPLVAGAILMNELEE